MTSALWVISSMLNIIAQLAEQPTVRDPTRHEMSSAVEASALALSGFMNIFILF
jgi:hypothetical protein